MYRIGHRLLLALILTISISVVSSHAQPKSVGLTSSFKGFAISYEHYIPKTNMFWEMSLAADVSEAFLYRTTYPGISLSMTWNQIFSSWELKDGTTMRLFAGPGVAVGYGNDFKTSHGYFFGLKGRAGVECQFERRVIISACISPILGMHMIPHSEYLALKYYRNGLFYSLVPEIGIKYRF